MKYSITILIALSPFFIYGQNCNVFLYQRDTAQYQACMLLQENNIYYQYSREYQELMDSALSICPEFSYAYRHKSVAYLKSGDFITWKKLIDKSVELLPKENLGYRGWCRYQFFRDYEGAIKDFELLEKISSDHLGYSAGGEYHLTIAKALCYKALENFHKAKEIIENKLNESAYDPGLYDYLHLGVLELNLNEPRRAISCFLKQTELYDMAENRFYLALAYKELGTHNKYVENMALAKEKYLENMRMSDPYTEMEDQIYLSDILNEEMKPKGHQR